MNGVNVVTYQTALAAYNKKYSETQHKVVEDKNNGDGSSKTTEQIKKEYDDLQLKLGSTIDRNQQLIIANSAKETQKKYTQLKIGIRQHCSE
jgi:hypothetical protein